LFWDLAGGLGDILFNISTGIYCNYAYFRFTN
jgi:hypothetical protein